MISDYRYIEEKVEEITSGKMVDIVQNLLELQTWTNSFASGVSIEVRYRLVD